jgi:hypothetical protein
LPSADKWTKSLLTNAEVIAVDQHSHDNRAALTTDTTAVWLARRDYQIEDERGGNQNYYLAVFNIGDSEQTVHYEWKDLGLKDASYRVRDLWERKNAGSALSLTVKLRPHASVLYRLTGKQ